MDRLEYATHGNAEEFLDQAYKDLRRNGFSPVEIVKAMDMRAQAEIERTRPKS